MTDLLGSVLPAATVTISQDGLHRSIVTGASGEAAFDDLAPGLYAVAARLEGFVPAYLPVSIGPCELKTVDLGLGLIWATDPVTCQVSGKVSIAGNQPFIAGVVAVASFNPTIRAEPSYSRKHRFEIRLPEPGRYFIFAYNDLYGTAAKEVVCERQRSINVSLKLR
ncbi:MAG: carboxypeptidase-like regulatory domain-containing protein [Thermoanaerobaculia bacterium]